MYHVNNQGIDEGMINVHYYYYYLGERARNTSPSKQASENLLAGGSVGVVILVARL